MAWSARLDYLQFDVGRDSHGRILVRLAGELDLSSRPVARRALSEAEALGCEEIVLDLSRVTFIDAQGLGLLIDAQRRAVAEGRALLLTHPHRTIRRLLELAGSPLSIASASASGSAADSAAVIALCNQALAAAVEIGDAGAGNVQLLDESAAVLRIAAHHGLGRHFLDYFEVVGDDDESACGHSLKRARATWVPDASRSPIFAGTPALDVLSDSGIRAVASVPVTASTGGEVVAMISIHHARSHNWSEAVRGELQRLAIRIGTQLDELANPAPA